MGGGGGTDSARMTQGQQWRFPKRHRTPRRRASGLVEVAASKRTNERKAFWTCPMVRVALALLSTPIINWKFVESLG